ncbi:MAG: hypothetical protein V1661_03615 [bacterium]
MSRENLIAGALILILGSAFLFITADISGYHVPHEADDMPQEIVNPRPYRQSSFIIRLPLIRQLNAFPEIMEWIFPSPSRRA